MYTENLIKIYEASFRNNFNCPALTDYTEHNLITYGDMATRIARTHIMFRLLGIKEGDRIALLGRNSTTWIMVYMATITYGAVIVPILHEFNPHDAQHILNHSGSKLLFVNESISDNIDYSELSTLLGAFSLDNKRMLWAREAADTETEGVKRKHPSFSTVFSRVSRHFKEKYPEGYGPLDISYPEIDGEHLAEINYTSGTTGFSKGVMLTHNNLMGNVVFGIRQNLHYKGSRALAFLPLAHAYGCAFDMLVPLAVGTHVTVLGRMPTPNVLIKAMAEVKPSLIICVPLILEKIYKKMIVPMISRGPISWVLMVPMLDMAIYSRIRAKLVEAFGGAFEEVIVGGAPLNSEVEQFLQKIKFPFTVGYGMTECGPLISYTHWKHFLSGSSGATLPEIMESKIDSPDPHNIPGEILVRGLNAMKGYYHNEEETNKAIDKDGWLHTGDMGTLGGEDGTTIFIRGRSKTMILGPGGQNIYPEEIEAKLNNMPYVNESLVIERNGRLVALVYPDSEAADANGLNDQQLREAMNTTRDEVNKLVAAYERIESIQLVPSEFEKTPKRSIKRFLYH